MRLIGSQYRETGAFFRKKLAFPTLFCTLFFFSVVFLSGWVFQQNQELLEQATEQIFTLFEGKNLEIEGHISPLLLLANNLIASAEGMLLGLLPFLFLPLVTLAINAAVIGQTYESVGWAPIPFNCSAGALFWRASCRMEYSNCRHFCLRVQWECGSASR